MKDQPKQIRFEVFPETKLKDDCEILLKSLAKHNLIVRYEVEKVKYIKVVNFLKHQSPHHTEIGSKYPDPPCITVSHRELKEDSGEIPLIPDSCILIPDSRIKDLSPEATPLPPNSGNNFNPGKLAELWNQTKPPELSKVNLPFRRKPKDLEKIKTAIRLNPDLIWWQNVFQKVHDSPFLRGDNDRQWKADFDFVIDRAERIMDGKYQGGGKKAWYE